MPSSSLAPLSFKVVIMKRYRSRAVSTVGLLTPGLGLLTLFVAVPILLTAWISLHRGSMAVPYSALQWVGLHNYGTIFAQATFRTALLNVFLYSLGNLAIILPLAILLGLFLYQTRVRGKQLIRTLLFLPYMIPTVAVAIVWGYLYEPQYGPLNQILGWLHLPAQDWLGSVHEALRSEEHTSELQSHSELVCRLLLEKK